MKDLTPTVDAVEEGGVTEEEEDMVVIEKIETGIMMVRTTTLTDGKKERLYKHYLETMKMRVVVDIRIMVNMVMKAEVKGGAEEGDEGREVEDMAVIVMVVTVVIEKREKVEKNKTTGLVRMKEGLRTEMERDMLTEPIREEIGMKGMISLK